MVRWVSLLRSTRPPFTFSNSSIDRARALISFFCVIIFKFLMFILLINFLWILYSMRRIKRYMTFSTIYILQLFHWQSAYAHFILLCHNLIIFKLLNLLFCFVAQMLFVLFDGAKVWLFWEEGKYLADFCLMLWRQEQQSATKWENWCRTLSQGPRAE